MNHNLSSIYSVGLGGTMSCAVTRLASTLFVLCGIAGNLMTASTVWAKNAPPRTELRVTLLGQTCLLEGPFNEGTLKAIHAIGPAQIYPVLTSADSPSALIQTQKALEKLKDTPQLPSLLDRYREKLTLRFGAQVAYLTALRNVEKNRNAFFPLSELYVRKEKQKAFEAQVKKFLSLKGKKGAQTADLNEQLFDLFNESIENDPEEEFHRAIKKLEIHYKCSFEEPLGE